MTLRCPPHRRLYIGNVLARYPAREPSLVYQKGDRGATVIILM